MEIVFWKVHPCQKKDAYHTSSSGKHIPSLPVRHSNCKFSYRISKRPILNQNFRATTNFCKKTCTLFISSSPQFKSGRPRFLEGLLWRKKKHKKKALKRKNVIYGLHYNKKCKRWKSKMWFMGLRCEDHKPRQWLSPCHNDSKTVWTRISQTVSSSIRDQSSSLHKQQTRHCKWWILEKNEVKTRVPWWSGESLQYIHTSFAMVAWQLFDAKALLKLESSSYKNTPRHGPSSYRISTWIEAWGWWFIPISVDDCHSVNLEIENWEIHRIYT